MALQGIDVSGWQPETITSMVDYDFVFIKATEGTGYVSRQCDPQYQAAKKRGKLLGVYHFASGGDPVAEAEYFYKAITGYIGEAIPVLDFEADAVGAWGDAGARRFLDRFYTLSSVRPLVYASGSVAATLRQCAAGNYGLWVASWGSNSQGGYRTPSKPSSRPFPFIVVHQYTSRGRLAGYNSDLDLNIAYIDARAWAKYANPTRTPAPAVKSVPAPTLVVDGLAGVATISHLQRLLGTPADGIISGQIRALHEQYFPAFITVHYGGTGSPMVTALQKKLGVTADGLLGRETITAWQKKLGVTADGIAGHATVAALQTALNNKLW